MPSFDIVSETDEQEVDNALDGVMREVKQRYDFKGSESTVERNGTEITILADDDLKLGQMHELIRTYLTRRKLDHNCLAFDKAPEKASGNMVRQIGTLKQGIDKELAKKITKSIKDAKMKVQVAIQGDELRVTGKKRDDLQAAIAHVKGMGIDQPLQYQNFRD